MVSQVLSSVENNFTKGLITESTGLNFPENAATDTDNCVYTLVGDVTRRLGFDYEQNFSLQTLSVTNSAISTYKWDNAGGDGVTQLVVAQVGATLQFYSVNNSTTASPLSTHKLASTVDLNTFLITGNSGLAASECQYTTGNGYLFVFNPLCDSFYCTYSGGTVTATLISIQVRDLVGIIEPTLYNARPKTLSPEHNYNLFNQGWVQAAPWVANSSTLNGYGFAPGTPQSFDVGTSTLPISPGDQIICQALGFPDPRTFLQSFSVSSYSGNIVHGTVVGQNIFVSSPVLSTNWVLTPSSSGNISTWNATVNNYPSNADVWWRYKNSSGAFSPSTTYQNVTISLGPAPKGHFILEAFNQQRAVISTLAGITPVVTTSRPSTGTWFAGRVWFTGINSSQAATGDATYYSWTENIYFSQVVTDASQFGLCYQTNDPTSQDLFDLLPTDGGVVTIQNSGPVYKLFPIQNGMLVFAANGVWFITGSQGIGFSANDYTITKISNVQSISNTSFVNVLGLPYFWNQEGIYTVAPSKDGGLMVEPITVGTILTFFDDIPKSNLNYVRGTYDPIEYTIHWIYKNTAETDITSRYRFDRSLMYNTYNKAFYPYTVSTGAFVNSVLYVVGPGGTSANPAIKYFCNNGSAITFAEERDTSYVDWKSTNGVGTQYSSFFITGFKIRGGGMMKFQQQYVRVYSRTNGAASTYKIQGLWDYASDPDSGRWSSEQLITNGLTRYSVISRRHKIRGQGFALQFKISSSDGQPFDIIGWAITDTVNQGA